jgi:hypothetical protein
MPADQDRSGDADLDAAFAEIIAGWDDPPAEPVARWPVAGDDATTPHDPSRAEAGAPSVPDHPVTEPAVEPGQAPELGPRDWEPAAPEEHYVPPEPPPLPRGSLPTRLAWGGVLLGPLFLLFAGLFWRDVGRLWVAVAAGAFIGGFIALVAQLPTSPEDEDDGAVV